MYGRSYKLVIPIALQGTIRKAEKRMTQHFGGVTVLPLAKGFWMNNKGKMIEDENIVLTSAKEYSKFQHPAMEHKKDQMFMEKLAERLGRTTRQKSMMLEEDLVGTLKFIEIHPQARKCLEKTI